MKQKFRGRMRTFLQDAIHQALIKEVKVNRPVTPRMSTHKAVSYQLYPTRMIDIAKTSTDRLARLLSLHTPYEIHRVPVPNRQRNRVFKPYFFDDTRIKYKEYYGSDFRVLHPDGEITFTDVMGIYKMATEYQITELYSWFKPIHKPIDQDHADNIISNRRFVGFFHPRGTYFRVQFIFQDGLRVLYRTIENKTKSYHRFRTNWSEAFNNAKEQVVLECIVPTNFSYIMPYDILYYKKDLSNAPYAERIKALFDFVDTHRDCFTDLALPRFYWNLETAYNEMTDQTLQCIDLAATYYSYHGYYKVRKRVRLPFIVRSACYRTRKYGRKLQHLNLGLYDHEGILQTYLKLKDFNRESSVVQTALHEDQGFLRGRVIYVEVDEFYDSLEYKNAHMIGRFYSRRSRRRNYCNVFSHLTL